MADTQEQLLTLVTTALQTDYIRMIGDPGGVPESQNITLAKLQEMITTLIGLTDMMIPTYQVRTTAAFDKTSDVTLADVPDLSINVAAGNNYRFTARLHFTANASGGVKASIKGTCVAGAVIFDGLLFYASTTKATRGVALGNTVSALATAAPNGLIEIKGLISVGTSGTLTVQFAQNASYATKSTVDIGSTFVVERLT